MRKNTGQAALLAVGGLALLGLAAACWNSTKLGAFFAALFGLGLICFAAFGCYECPCPDCGKPVSMDGATGFVRCPHCKRYAQPTRQGLDRLSSDFVADVPVFGIPFERELQLPEACCVCRKAATRSTTLGAKMENTLPGGSVGEGLKKNVMLGAGVRPMLEVSVDVPHCDEHKAEARIFIEQGGGSLVDPEDPKLVLSVRSYSFYRDAVGLS